MDCFFLWLGRVSLIIWLWLGVQWMYRWLWPSWKDWRGSLSLSRDELRGENATRWKFHSPQEIGQSFRLDIRKHKGKGRGKARLIKQVRFLQGGEHQWDCPSEYKMIVEGRSTILGEFDGRAGKPWNGECYKGISEDFEPLLAEVITVIITTTSEHPEAECWATNDISIMEVRIPWLPKWRLVKSIREWVIHDG